MKNENAKAAFIKLHQSIMEEPDIDLLEEIGLPSVSKLKTLNLTLSSKPFEVMVTGEKNVEFRKPSEWMKSRLFDKNGKRKEYDVVKFTNGYGKDKPFFVAIFNGFGTFDPGRFKGESFELYYSNGLEVILEEGDFRIYLGDIIQKGNLK